MPDSLSSTVDWIREAGPLGAAVYLLVFVVANVAFVPATVLTIGGGFTCGFASGAVVAAVGRAVAGSIAFLLSRRVFRASVAARARRHPRFEAVDRALAADGFRIVVLLRLSPIFPSTISNYVLGATRVRFADFVRGTALGTLPTTLLYAGIGAGLGAVSDLVRGDHEAGAAGRALFWLGLIATAVAVAVVTRRARFELERLSLTGRSCA